MNAALAVGVAITAAIAIAVVLWVVLMRRGVTRRIAAVTARLEASSQPELRGSTEDHLARLERAADIGMIRASDALAVADRLREALGHVAEGVVVCDEHGEVVFRNDRAAAFVGARHGEALAERTLEEVLNHAVAGRTLARTLQLYGPPRRVLTIAGAPLDDGTRTIGAVAVVEDVSERRHLESVRRDFVANMSHELKTPVSALGLLAETIVAEEDVHIVRRLAQRMTDEAIRVGRIIDDLLDLSRIEAEEQPHREPVPVDVVVAQAGERIRPVAEHRAIAIEIGDISRRLTVLGDRRQLVSAVHHLLENAVKYSDDGTVVTVEVRTNGTTVEISVRDSGVGVPQRDLERIFERFYRVDRSRARDTGGTGLGLAIVRHIATNHGGDVRVHSQEGQGSTFTLRLPAGPGPVAVSGERAAG